MTMPLHLLEQREREPGHRARMFALRYAVRGVAVDDDLEQLLYRIARDEKLGDDVIDLIEAARLVERKGTINFYTGGKHHADGRAAVHHEERPDVVQGEEVVG